MSHFGKTNAHCIVGQKLEHFEIKCWTCVSVHITDTGMLLLQSVSATCNRQKMDNLRLARIITLVCIVSMSRIVSRIV